MAKLAINPELRGITPNLPLPRASGRDITHLHPLNTRLIKYIEYVKYDGLVSCKK